MVCSQLRSVTVHLALAAGCRADVSAKRFEDRSGPPSKTEPRPRESEWTAWLACSTRGSFLERRHSRFVARRYSRARPRAQGVSRSTPALASLCTVDARIRSPACTARWWFPTLSIDLRSGTGRSSAKWPVMISSDEAVLRKRERNLGRRRRSKRRRHAGHDLKLDSCRRSASHLFPRPAEDQRIAALQAHHLKPLPGEFDHEEVNFLLARALPATTLAYVVERSSFLDARLRISGDTKSSCRTASASRRMRAAFNVSSSGSPGPAPTRYTLTVHKRSFPDSG